ncbi:MAG: hypothetical protein GY924_14215, partial [Planctomycetaceae bacterium]|nr:hypothetical protein [Planctomycetaceae bacterium]
MSQPTGRLSSVVGSYCWLMLGCLTLCTVLTFFFSQFWIADLFANLRVQLVLVGLPVLLVGLFLRQWRLVLLACVVLALHLPC